MWMTRSANSMKMRMRQQWSTYKITEKESDYNIYKRLRNMALKERRKAKKSLETKLADNIKEDPKSFTNMSIPMATLKT